MGTLSLSLPTPSREPDPDFRMEVQPASGRVVVAGVLDRGHCHLLLDGLRLLAGTSHRVWRLDLSDVSSCDGGGLRTLLDGHRLARRHGRRLAVLRSSACVHRLLVDAGLHTLLCAQGCEVAPGAVTAATTER